MIYTMRFFLLTIVVVSVLSCKNEALDSKQVVNDPETNRQAPPLPSKEELIMEVAIAMNWGNQSAAEKHLRVLIPMLSNDSDQQHIYLEALANMVRVTNKEEAASLMERVVEIRRNQSGDKSTDLARALTSLAGIVVETDEARGIELLVEARNAMEKDQIPDPVQYASTVFAISVADPKAPIDKATTGLKKTKINTAQIILLKQYAQVFAETGQKENAIKLNELLKMEQTKTNKTQ